MECLKRNSNGPVWSEIMPMLFWICEKSRWVESENNSEIVFMKSKSAVKGCQVAAIEKSMVLPAMEGKLLGIRCCPLDNEIAANVGI